MGATAGTLYDQLQVTGAVDLNGATLTLSRAAGYVPSGSTPLVLIANDDIDAVTGTFSGLTEGAFVTFPGDARPMFTISYHGGTGNDVVLNPIVPGQVYVDDSWTGTTVGTTPATSYPAGLIFGYDAFATVQGGLTQVASAGTLTVYGGTYSDSVNVATALAEIVAATNPNVSAQTTVQLDGELTLGVNATFRETDATNLIFAKAVHGTTAGLQTLTITGSNGLTFQAAVGHATTPLASLTAQVGSIGGDGLLTATTLSLTASAVSGDGIGSAAHPLHFAVTNLDTNTSSGNTNQYLSASGTATLAATGLKAGSGTIELDGGTFALGGAGRVADASTLSVASGATFQLNAFDETIGSLTGAGAIVNGSTIAATLTLAQANDTTFSGVLGGSTAVDQNFTLVKAGAGTLTL